AARSVALLVGRAVGVPADRYLRSAPWPHAIDLHFEREAQEDPDHDDDAERRHAFDGGVDNDGPDDVSDDQDLEAEQDGAPETPAQRVVGLPGRVGVERFVGEPTETAERPD